MEKFVLFHPGHVGSHFLMNILNKHDEIHCYPEILLHEEKLLHGGIEAFIGKEMADVLYKGDNDFYYLYLLKKVKEDPVNITFNKQMAVFGEFIDYLFEKNKNKQGVGIGVSFQQSYWIPNFFQQVKDRGLKFIVLRRRNILKQLLSGEISRLSERTGRKTHVTKVEKMKYKLSLRPDETLINSLNSIKQQYETIRKFIGGNFEMLELFYEDMLHDAFSQENDQLRPETMKKIYDFLNISVRPMDLRSDLKKTNPARLADLVQNFDEIAAFLRGSQWEYVLDC